MPDENVLEATEKVIAAPAAPETYDASKLGKLEGLEAVRKKPGMYIGGTDERALHHCVTEVLDNSVDEYLAGHCTRIDVTVHVDGSISIRDNGRGIPVDMHPEYKIPGVELVLTTLHSFWRHTRGWGQVCERSIRVVLGGSFSRRPGASDGIRARQNHQET